MMKKLLAMLMVVLLGVVLLNYLDMTRQQRAEKQLYLAIKENNLEKVKKLFDQLPGLSNVVLKNTSGEIKLVEPSIQKPTEDQSEHESSFYYGTLLHYAVYFQQTDIVAFLLNSGPGLNEVDSFARTPLIIAAENGNYAIAHLLIASRANLDVKGKRKWTALHMAAQNGHADIAEMLLNADADIDVKDKNGKTPLHLASGANETESRTDTNDRRQVIEVLIAHNADVNAKDTAGKTALDYAAENDFKGIADILRAYGAVEGTQADTE